MKNVNSLKRAKYWPAVFLFVLTASPCFGQASEDQWRAWSVTEGGNTKLVVEGIYSHGGPGIVVQLEPAVPQGINPEILLLELKRKHLPGVWPEIILPVPGHYTKSPYKGGYKSIQIRYPNGDIATIAKITNANDVEKKSEKNVVRIYDGVSSEGKVQAALEDALSKLDKDLSNGGVIDALSHWTLDQISGERGGIAGLRTVKVRIKATRTPPWKK